MEKGEFFKFNLTQKRQVRPKILEARFPGKLQLMLKFLEWRLSPCNLRKKSVFD